MISAIIYILIGILIGWNIPRPEWIKDIQDKLIEYVKILYRKIRKE